MTDHRYILGSNDPCCDANPVLWNLFCAMTNRPLGIRSEIWSEQFVLEAMLARGLKEVPKQYLD